MKMNLSSISALLGLVVLLPLQRVHADDTVPPEFRSQLLQLCDLTAAKVTDETNKEPFFVDSYGIRALCVAYDMTHNTNYLNACIAWSDRMVRYQKQMIPRDAYYMHYNRKPGETNGDWFAADSSSIGMGVLATAVRCHGAEQRHLKKSAKKFADLVIDNYVRPSGGVSDGCWHKSNAEWWCSSGLFGSFAFNLYASTGDKHYLKAALGVTDWLNHWDPTADQPFPLSQQGPAMIMYVMENYSAGWPYISADSERRNAALAKVSWCLNWMQEQQLKPVTNRSWAPTVWWGMKFGGLPFHEYIFSGVLNEKQLANYGDTEMQRLVPVAFAKNPPELDQLQMFMMMSYAERLDPGDIYRARQSHWF